MKARSGIEAIRMVPVNKAEDTWRIWKGHKNIGIVQWRGAVPFKVRVPQGKA